jgi:hypothetical protein
LGLTGQKAAAAPASSYTVASLPASDAVVFIDAQRLLTDAIPGVLANEPTLLARINARIDEFKEKTNVDLRTFDHIAIGVRFDEPAKMRDFKFVVLAQGRFDASALVDAALVTTKREGGPQPQERQYDGRTIFVIGRSAKKVEQEAQTEEQIKAQEKRDAEAMAFAAFDANTFAFGNFESVRAALDISRERVNDELAQLATRNPSAVVGFSGNVPKSVSDNLSRDSEAIAQTFAAIRQVYGHVTTNGTETETSLTLRTENPDQAREISKSVSALKLLSGFNTQKSSDGQTPPLANLIKKLTVTSEGNEVFLNLKFERSDVTPFARGLRF